MQTPFLTCNETNTNYLDDPHVLCKALYLLLRDFNDLNRLRVDIHEKVDYGDDVLIALSQCVNIITQSGVSLLDYCNHDVKFIYSATLRKDQITGVISQLNKELMLNKEIDKMHLITECSDLPKLLAVVVAINIIVSNHVQKLFNESGLAEQNEEKIIHSTLEHLRTVFGESPFIKGIYKMSAITKNCLTDMAYGESSTDFWLSHKHKPIIFSLVDGRCITNTDHLEAVLGFLDGKPNMQFMH